MIEKHMKNVIKSKLESWAESVDDEAIKKIILNKTILTGGAIVSMIQNEDPKDYDIYFKDYESTLAIAKYYTNKFNNSDKGNKHVQVLTPYNINKILEDSKEFESQRNYRREDHEASVARQIKMSSSVDGDRVYLYVYSDGIATAEDKPFEDVYETTKVEETEEEREKYVVKYISPNAITLSDKIQAIVRFYGDPSKIHNTFDYIHTKGYYTSWNDELVIPREVYEAVANHVLIYTGSRYPIASVIRSRKFIKRGWTINAGQYLKMAYQISHLNLDDLDILRDQLVGVDSAYFDSLLKALKLNGVDESYGTEYICKIIDKIF